MGKEVVASTSNAVRPNDKEVVEEVDEFGWPPIREDAEDVERHRHSDYRVYERVYKNFKKGYARKRKFDPYSYWKRGRLNKKTAYPIRPAKNLNRILEVWEPKETVGEFEWIRDWYFRHCFI